MAEIQFPNGFEGVKDLPKTKKILTNCFRNDRGDLLTIPGINELNTTGNVARGQFKWNGALYQVVSTSLIKITDVNTGAFTTIGTIVGSNNIQTAIGFVDAVIVVIGGAIYTLGKDDSTVSISSVGSAAGGIARFNHSGLGPNATSTVTITGFSANPSYNVESINVSSISFAISSTNITSVNDSVANPGTASFVHAGTSPQLGQEVTISGFTTVIPAIPSTSISGVSNNGGIAVFTHAGSSPSLGQQVTISGFAVNTDYNVTGTVTLTTATTFEVSTIAFGADEAGGSYIGIAADNTAYNTTDTVTARTVTTFEISSIVFGTDEATGSYVGQESFTISSILFGTDETSGFFAVILTNILSNANFRTCVSVTHKDNRFIYCPADGSPVFFSDVGKAGVVQVESFFDAEQLPDKNNQVWTLKNILYIAGTDSIEQFQNRGTSPVPFVRSNAGAIDTGFIGGRLEYKNTFLFVGRDKNQDFGIYSIGSGIAPKISNKAIDTILATYTPDELTEAVASRLKWEGDDIATFTFRRDSFGFFNGEWFILERLIDGDSIPWGGGFITEFDGAYFTAFEDKIGKFIDLNTQYGERMTRLIQFGVRQPDGQWFTVQSLSLGISQGFNDIETSSGVAIQVSRDNVLFSEPFYRDVSQIGKYADKLEWNYPGGMGVYQGFMAVRIFTTEDVKFSSDHLILDANGPLQLA